MLKLLLFAFLLVTCWPLALVCLFLYPILWLCLLPLRLVGLAVGGAFHLVEAIFLLPLALLRPRRPYYDPARRLYY